MYYTSILFLFFNKFQIIFLYKKEHERIEKILNAKTVYLN